MTRRIPPLLLAVFQGQSGRHLPFAVDEMDHKNVDRLDRWRKAVLKSSQAVPETAVYHRQIIAFADLPCILEPSERSMS